MGKAGAGPWEALGAPAPAAITEARLEAHWAAQIVAAAGHTHLPAEADDSHTSLDWVPAVGAFAGQPLPGGIRPALLIGEARLAVLDAGDRVLEEMPLAGRTLDEGYRWMGERLAAALGRGGKAPRELRRRDYEMPEHPVARGGRFGGPSAGSAELARWYAAAASALRGPAARPEASPVRCWPHHFDLAVLLTVRPGPPAATVGIGLSPGDASYAEPYWYVTPYPYPPREVLPPLPAGAWHDRGWFGAVITGGAIVAQPAARRERLVSSFLESAIGACLALLGRVPAGG